MNRFPAPARRHTRARGVLPHLTALALLIAMAPAQAGLVELFSDSFTSGDTSAWASAIPKVFLDVNSSAALDGDGFGLEVSKEDASAGFVADTTPAAEPRYRADFSLDPNDFSLANGEEITLLRLIQAPPLRTAALVSLRGTAAGLEVYGAGLDTAVVLQTTAAVALGGEVVRLSLVFEAATSSDNPDGRIALFIDGVPVAERTDLQNDGLAVDTARLGAQGPATGTGSFYLDDFESFRLVSPEIEADMVADPASVPPGGGDVSFEFTVSNTGPVAVTVTTMTATIDGTSADLATACALPRAIAAAGSFQCSLLSAVAGSIGELIPASVAVEAEDDTNEVAVAEDATAVAVVGPSLAASLTAALVVDGGQPGVTEPGDTVRFTATITNAGNAAATDVSFVAPAVSDAALVVGSVATTAGSVVVGNTAGNTSVNVNFGAIAPDGGVATIAFDVVIDNPLGAAVTSIASQGTVNGPNIAMLLTDDPGVGGGSDPTSVAVTAAPLLGATLVDTLQIDGGESGLADPGDTLAYTLQVTNVGNRNAADVVANVGAIIDTTLQVGTVTTTTGLIAEGNDGGDDAVEVEIGGLAGGGGRATITFEVRIDDPLPDEVDRITAQASILDATPAIILSDDPDTGAPNDATITFLADPPPQVALAVTKTDGLAAIGEGEQIDYLIVVTNTGPDDAVGATVSDPVPAGLGGVTWACEPGDGASCAISGGGNLLDSADIPAGSEVVYTVTGTVTAATGAVIVNVVSVTAPEGSEEADVSDNEATDRTAVGDLVFEDGFEDRLPGSLNGRATDGLLVDERLPRPVRLGPGSHAEPVRFFQRRSDGALQWRRSDRGRDGLWRPDDWVGLGEGGER